MEILKFLKFILVVCVDVLRDMYVWILGLMWKNMLSNINFDRKVDIKWLMILNLLCNEIKIIKIYL